MDLTTMTEDKGKISFAKMILAEDGSHLNGK